MTSRVSRCALRMLTISIHACRTFFDVFGFSVFPSTVARTGLDVNTSSLPPVISRTDSSYILTMRHFNVEPLRKLSCIWAISPGVACIKLLWRLLTGAFFLRKRLIRIVVRRMDNSMYSHIIRTLRTVGSTLIFTIHSRNFWMASSMATSFFFKVHRSCSLCLLCRVSVWVPHSFGGLKEQEREV